MKSSKRPAKIADSGQSRKSEKNLVQAYMCGVKNYKLLSREREIELARRIRQNGDKAAADEMTTSNLRLVVKIALNYQRAWKLTEAQLLDLIQEGNVGLLKAAWKYNPDKNTKFSYYASFWIRAHIIRFIMENWSIVKIGTTQAQKNLFFNLKSEQDKLKRMGIRPESGVVAQRMGIPKQEVDNMAQRLGGRDVSLNGTVSNDKDTERIEFLNDPADSIEEQLAWKESMALLSEKVSDFRKNLSLREDEIFVDRIFTDTPMTLQELGDRFGLSRERIRQLEKCVLQKARDFFYQVTRQCFPEQPDDMLQCWI